MRHLPALLSCFFLACGPVGADTESSTDATGTTWPSETESTTGGSSSTSTSGGSASTYMATETGPITGAEEFCSDGVQQPHEPCDDGPVQNDGHYEGCRADCELGPHCGDGVIDLGWEACDDDNLKGGDGCPSDCGVSACGELF